MALTLKGSTKAARFEYEDGSMTVSWTLEASLTDDELADRLRRIVSFYDAQMGRPELPQRIPTMALGMAREAHPAPMVEPGNGWAAMVQPEIPERLQSEVEMMPRDEPA
ncbi:hypothetical protein ACIBL6_08920 [Streptomyces sp. NPDC050400]|uniref:hypothetical protein n=1 Tax=Streptomyces sp. NPDC050400 TaxID=3365610 RepID=UPI00379FB803